MRVLLQAHGVAEGFAADVTGEGPGPAVGAADVHLEPVRGGEHLGAGQHVRPPEAAERGLGRGPMAAPPTSVPSCRHDGCQREPDCQFWGMCCVAGKVPFPLCGWVSSIKCGPWGTGRHPRPYPEAG